MDYAAAVNAEIKDLHAAGADVVQIDEPYLQARPDAARAYGLAAAEPRRWTASPGTTAVHLCFGYAAIIHERPSGYSFLPELAGCPVDQISIETAQSGLDLGVLADLSDKTIILGRAGPVDARGRDRRGRRRTGAPGLPVPAGGAARDRAGLRDEVPPAGVRGGQDAGHGRRGRAAACRAVVGEESRCSWSPRRTSPTWPRRAGAPPATRGSRRSCRRWCATCTTSPARCGSPSPSGWPRSSG